MKKVNVKRIEKINFSVKKKSPPVKFALLCFLPLSLMVILSGCNREEGFYLENLKKLEKPRYPEKEIDKKSIEELKDGIKRYKREVDRTIKASEQIGIYYKMLAVRYMNAKMYGKAFESLKKAIKYYPENEILFYLAAVSVARMSKAIIDDEAEKKRLTDLAEKYYLRALALEPFYRDALFGLSVLYVFEKNMPEKAIPYLKKLLLKEKSDTDAMFLLARAYYEAGEYESAIDMYDRIIKTTKSALRKREAEKNRDEIKAEIYEGK